MGEGMPGGGNNEASEEKKNKLWENSSERRRLMKSMDSLEEQMKHVEAGKTSSMEDLQKMYSDADKRMMELNREAEVLERELGTTIGKLEQERGVQA